MLGFNFIELDEELALRLLEVLKLCPLRRLNIVGNDFPKKVKKAYTNEFQGKASAGKPVLSNYSDDEDDDDEVTRLLSNLTI